MDKCDYCIHNHICAYKHESETSLICADNFIDVDQCLKIPCSIGSTVYKIHKFKNKRYWINAYQVIGAHLRDGDSYLVVRHVDSRIVYHIPFGQINVTVFLSKSKTDEIFKELSEKG